MAFVTRNAPLPTVSCFVWILPGVLVIVRRVDYIVTCSSRRRLVGESTTERQSQVGWKLSAPCVIRGQRMLHPRRPLVQGCWWRRICPKAAKLTLFEVMDPRAAQTIVLQWMLLRKRHRYGALLPSAISWYTLLAGGTRNVSRILAARSGRSYSSQTSAGVFVGYYQVLLCCT